MSGRWRSVLAAVLAAGLGAGCSASGPPTETRHAAAGPRETALNGERLESTPTTVDTSQPGWEQRKGEAARDLVQYPWRELGWTIVFGAARPEVISVTIPAYKRIEVYVRAEMPLIEIAHALAHELGHAHDITYWDAACRQEWREARGFPGNQRWIAPDGTTDYGLPGGDYAEVFALVALGGKGPFKGTLAPRPDPEGLRSLRRFFEPGRSCRGSAL